MVRDGKNMESEDVRFYQPSTYDKDWKTLTKTKHITHDRERSNRFLKLQRDSNVVMVWKEINKDNYILFLDTGDRLIVTNSLIITILTADMNLSHKNVILWDNPFIRRGEKWFD